MIPENNSNSVPRGRIQAAKPLAAGASTSLSVPTASSRAKAKAPAFTNTSLPEKRATSGVKASASSNALNATPKTSALPRQTGVQRQTATSSAKPRSQSLKTTLKEPLKKPITTETTTVLEINIPPEEPTHKKEEFLVASDTSNDNASVAPVSEPLENVDPKDAASSSALPPSADPLQVAAQTYPWLYMSSKLDACFAEAEKTATKELDKLEKEVTQGEAELADERLRYESERLIEFCDELGSDTFAKEAPTIMQSFISFGEACERVEQEVMQVVSAIPSLESEEPLRAYHAIMDNLDELQEQASDLESSILRLTESTSPSSTPPSASPSSKTLPTPDTEKEEMGVDGDGDDQDKEKKVKLKEDASSARAQIIGVFAACLPVLRARIANLSTAQELIDSAQENFSLALRMESMGID